MDPAQEKALCCRQKGKSSWTLDMETMCLEFTQVFFFFFFGLALIKYCLTMTFCIGNVYPVIFVWRSREIFSSWGLWRMGVEWVHSVCDFMHMTSTRSSLLQHPNQNWGGTFEGSPLVEKLIALLREGESVFFRDTAPECLLTHSSVEGPIPMSMQPAPSSLLV